MNPNLYDRLSSILANNNNLSALPSVSSDINNNNNHENPYMEAPSMSGGAFYGGRMRRRTRGGYFKHGKGKKSGWYERKHPEFGYGPVSPELRAYFEKHSKRYSEYLPPNVKWFKTSRHLGLTDYQKFVKQQFIDYWPGWNGTVQEFMQEVGKYWRQSGKWQDSGNRVYNKTHQRFVGEHPNTPSGNTMNNYAMQFGNPYGTGHRPDNIRSGLKTRKKIAKIGEEEIQRAIWEFQETGRWPQGTVSQKKAEKYWQRMQNNKMAGSALYGGIRKRRRTTRRRRGSRMSHGSCGRGFMY